MKLATVLGEIRYMYDNRERISLIDWARYCDRILAMIDELDEYQQIEALEQYDAMF